MSAHLHLISRVGGAIGDYSRFISNHTRTLRFIYTHTETHIHTHRQTDSHTHTNGQTNRPAIHTLKQTQIKTGTPTF